MNVVSWGDINRSPDAGEFPFRDGTLSVSFADVAAWKCDPTASFLRMRKHPNRGQIGYVLGEQINQGQPCCESSNGDVWCLTLDAASGRRVVIHRPNAQSGGKVSYIAVENFLEESPDGPQHEALRGLIQPA
jgi:hypothetical protein